MRVKIGTPEIAVLREEVEQRFGCPIQAPRHFSALSFDIEENQNEYLSETTLQRVWLYKSGYDTVAVHTLNVLCRYCGYANWSIFLKCLKNSSPVESEMFSGDVLDASSLDVAARVRIGWRPDRICVFEYLGDLHFKVVESHNAKLQSGDVFTCSKFQLGRELRLDNLMRDETEMSYVAGTRNGLTLLELIKD